MGNLPSTPAPPTLTEQNIPDQTGKVFVITGATSGIGKELAQILYAAHARVWIVARSASKAEATITDLRNASPKSRGELEFLQLDFDDLRSIKPAVREFRRRESRIDVLWNNAGVMIPPKGTVTKQNYEAQLGVNVLAPFLFTKLVTPMMGVAEQDVKQSAPRIVWVSSSAAANFAPQGGVEIDKLKGQNGYSQWENYGISKAGSILLASEFGRRENRSDVISVAIDPGNLATNLYQHMPKVQAMLVKKVALKPPIYGAYTELYAGLSKDVGVSDNGAWIIPWGKKAIPRADIDVARKAESEGGSGVARKFWEWCEVEVRPYV